MIKVFNGTIKNMSKESIVKLYPGMMYILLNPKKVTIEGNKIAWVGDLHAISDTRTELVAESNRLEEMGYSVLTNTII